MRLINRDWTCKGRQSFITFAFSFIFTCLFFFLIKIQTNKNSLKVDSEKTLLERKKKSLSSLKPDFRPLQAAICRSSQPLSGFSARCLEDEQMLEAILRSNPRSDFMYVVDTRPKVRPYCSTNSNILVYVCVFSGGLGLFFLTVGCAHNKTLENILDMFP